MFASLSIPDPLARVAALRARVAFIEFSFKRDTEIFGENEPADYVYQVTSGAVRSYKLLSDGRRQIGAFHLAGDVFGLENAAVHRFTAEAIVATKVRLVKRESMERIAENDVVVVRDLLNATTSSLQHAENHMLLLGRKTALERVAAFLLEMDRRLTAGGLLCAANEPTRYRGLSGAYGRDRLPRAAPSSRQGNSGIFGLQPTSDRASGPRTTREAGAVMN